MIIYLFFRSLLLSIVVNMFSLEDSGARGHILTGGSGFCSFGEAFTRFGLWEVPLFILQEIAGRVHTLSGLLFRLDLAPEGFGPFSSGV